MLTDKEMLEIAEKYLKKLEDRGTRKLMLRKNTLKKDYGDFYFFNSKKYVETGDINKSIGGNGPFLVEKEKRRVVQFGSLGVENQIEAYENGTMVPALNTYWYPDEDRFSHN